MKSILFTLGLLVAFNAQAENLYRCDVQVADKAGHIGLQERVIYLSQNRYSDLQFSAYDTELSLLVKADGKVTGFVDDKKDFILSGSVNGTILFESATAEGNIICDAAKNVEAALYFKPWKAIAVQGDKDLYLDIGAAQEIPNYCYFGDVKAAQNILTASLNIPGLKSVITKDGIVVTTNEQKCVRSIGAYDDYQCLEWKAVTVNRTLSNCDAQADNR